MKRKVLNLILGVTCLIAAGFLAFRLYEASQEGKRIANQEQRIIERLTDIRTAQMAYRSIHNKYTNNWDSLFHFIEKESFPIVERRENIVTLAYGADSVSVVMDTLAMIPVKDSLFSGWKPSKIHELQKIPALQEGNSEYSFALYAGKINKTPIFEAKDVAPTNPLRQGALQMDTLRVGSRTEVTTKGNWEK